MFAGGKLHTIKKIIFNFLIVVFDKIPKSGRRPEPYQRTYVLRNVDAFG